MEASYARPAKVLLAVTGVETVFNQLCTYSNIYFLILLYMPYAAQKKMSRKKTYKRPYRRQVKRIGYGLPRTVGSNVHFRKMQGNVVADTSVGMTIPTTANFVCKRIYGMAEDIPGFPNVAICFSEYRLLGIKVKLLPEANVVTGSATGNNAQLPTLFSCIDYQPNTTAKSSVNEIRAYSSCKATYGDRPHTRYFKSPRIANSILDKANASQPAVGLPVWIPTFNQSVPHFAGHVAAEITNNPTNDKVFTWEITYYLAFRGTQTTIPA